MRMVHSHRVLGGLALVLLACGGSFGALGAAGIAASPPARSSALPRRLGYVGSVSASLRRPIGKRAVIRPHLTYVVRRSELARVRHLLALRHLRTRHPRLQVTFAVRIRSVPRHGRARTLAARSRTLTGLALIASARRSDNVVALHLRRLLLSRAQTAKIKRVAGRRGRLRITSRASFRVRFTARHRTVTLTGRPWSFSWILSFSPARLGGKGAKLHRLAARIRHAVRTVNAFPLACQTRSTLARQLELAGTVLLSGQRTSARTIFGALIANARSLRAGKVLPRRQQVVLRDRLRAIRRRVGTGVPLKLRRAPAWPALPRCGGRASAADSYTVWDPNDVKTVLDTIVRQVPVVGKFLGPLISIFWPSSDPTAGIEQLISAKLSTTVKELVSSDLEGLESDVGDFEYHEAHMSPNGSVQPAAVYEDFKDTRKFFIDHRADFQVAGYQWDLLPLYAQFENLYLSFIREVELNGLHFGMSISELDAPDGVYQHDFLGNDPESLPPAQRNAVALRYADEYLTKVHEHQIRVDLGCKYPDSTTDNSGCTTDPAEAFKKTNADERTFKLQVSDYQALWRLLDPQAYPFGEPNYRPTGMVYSDLVGKLKTKAFSAPADPAYPLTSITACDKYIPTTGYWYMGAIKAENAPLTGAFTGDTQSTCTAPSGGSYNQVTWPRTDSQGHYYGGPIVAAKAYRVDNSNVLTVARIDFTFANGLTDYLGPKSNITQPQEFSYPEEKLQAVKIIGSWRPAKVLHPNTYVGDSVVFGFTYADGFYPSGEVHLAAAAGNCMDLSSWASETQALLAPCRSTASAAQDWTYESSTRELTSSGGEASGGTLCLEARPEQGGATGSAVQIYRCRAAADALKGYQEWIMSSDGTIRNVKADLCVQPAGGSTASGTRLQLSGCDGSAAQRWSTPWTTPLPGHMRAPGANRCLQIADASRAPGTGLQMDQCSSDWRQSWHWADTADLAGNPPSYALMAYGGTECMAPARDASSHWMTSSGPTAGTAWPPPAHTLVAVYDCNGDQSQEWTVNPDGSIHLRSADASNLCLDRSNDSAGQTTPIQLEACDGSVAQRWSWPVG